MNKQNPIPKVVALMLVSLGIACLMKAFDAASLTRLDSMSAADCLQHERALHQHSLIFHYISWLVVGGFFLGVVEFVAYLISLVFPKKTDA